MVPPNKGPVVTRSVVRIIECHRRMTQGLIAGIVCYEISKVILEQVLQSDVLSVLQMIVLVVLYLFLAFWVFRLARELYDSWKGVACILLLCFAPTAFLVLTLLNFRAMDRISSAGHQVKALGICGARLRQLKDAIGPLWSVELVAASTGNQRFESP